jgi:D-serine deaminase-like pyridoxal phosphate-dependent protein
MPTITIHNGGPGAINVTETSGQITTMGEGTSNVFQSPLHIVDVGADRGIEEALSTEPPLVLTEADALADLEGRPRPDAAAVSNIGAADASVAGEAIVTKAVVE